MRDEQPTTPRPRTTRRSPPRLSARAVASTAGFREDSPRPRPARTLAHRSILHTPRAEAEQAIFPLANRIHLVVNREDQGRGWRRRTPDRERSFAPFRVDRKPMRSRRFAVYHEKSRLVCVRHCIFNHRLVVSIALCSYVRTGSFAIVAHETAGHVCVTPIWEG